MSGYLDQLREKSMSLPDAVEDYPWGDIVWKVGGKMFAATGPSGSSVTVKATLDQQAALIQLPNLSVAKYVGKYGWVTVNLADDETLAFALDLIEESYGQVAKKRR